MTRRPLKHLGGPTRSGGEADVARGLRAAFEAAAREPRDRWTHGFHSYPARMHPALARVVVEAWSQPGQRVLDPFCGSGTVALEAMVAGRRPVGVDLNPVALRIAAIKCERRDANERAAFAAYLGRVVEASKQRVRKRVAVQAPLSRKECGYYAPHVLKELAGLWTEIQAVDAPSERAALEVLFSAIVVKFSRQRADTSHERVDKRIGRFIPSEFFERKGLELLARWEALAAACDDGPRPVPEFREGDARRLRELELGAFDLVVTSPPYGGTYDYVDHHARRLAWLGMRHEEFATQELGARRRLSAGSERRRWDQELGAALAAIAGATSPDGLIVVLLGDARIAGESVEARAQLQRLAPALGLDVVAWAWQPRPEWQGGPPRRESLVALRHGSSVP